MPPPASLNETGARELAVKQGSGRRRLRLSRAAAPRLSTDAESSGSRKWKRHHDGVGKRGEQGQCGACRDENWRPRIRTVLGDETSESAQLFAMETLNARSLDVIQSYARAMEALNRGKYEEARQHAREAARSGPGLRLGIRHPGGRIGKSGPGARGGKVHEGGCRPSRQRHRARTVPPAWPLVRNDGRPAEVRGRVQPSSSRATRPMRPRTTTSRSAPPCLRQIAQEYRGDAARARGASQERSPAIEPGGLPGVQQRLPGG